MDTYFHRPEFQALDRKLHSKPQELFYLRNLATAFTNGDHGGLNYVAQGVRYLRGQSVTEHDLNLLSDALYISDAEHTRMLRSEVLPGDVLLTIAGSIGNSCVVRGVERANINQAIVRIRLKDDIVPEYLVAFLNSHLGRFQTQRIANGAVQLNINFSEVGNLLILLPPASQQLKLLEGLDAARETRRAKLAEADGLLAGLDGFLLETLGLVMPAADTRKVFGARLGELTNRTDADFYSPRFRAVRKAIAEGPYPVRPMEELCLNLETGFAAGRQDQAFGYDLGVPHLRPLNLNIYGELSLAGTKFAPKLNLRENEYCKVGEVLFNNTNSAELVGKSTVFDLDELCACSNHMTRIRVNADVNPYYLAALFNTLRSIGYLALLSTKFNNQAGINLDTLKPLGLPVPPESVQKSIANEVRRRREDARRLRAAAEEGWQAAKRTFEEQLLGSVPQ